MWTSCASWGRALESLGRASWTSPGTRVIPRDHEWEIRALTHCDTRWERSPDELAEQFVDRAEREA